MLCRCSDLSNRYYACKSVFLISTGIKFPKFYSLNTSCMFYLVSSLTAYSSTIKVLIAQKVVLLAVCCDVLYYLPYFLWLSDCFLMLFHS